MLGWIQRVLPQPPATPHDTNTEEEEAEADPGPEPQPTGEETESLPSEDPPEGEDVAAAEPSPEGTQAPPTLPTTAPQAPVAVGPDMNSPSGRVLSWLGRSMEKVVPQPLRLGAPTSSPEAGAEGLAQAGPQAQGHCSSGCSGQADGPSDTLRAQDTGPWLLHWFEQNLEKVLPQPPPTCESYSEKTSGATPNDHDADLPGPPLEMDSALQVPESPPLSSPSPPEPEEEPVPEVLLEPQATSLPPPEDRVRLVAWLLHRLEKVLPQPVFHGKAEEQEPEATVTCEVQSRVVAAGGQ